MFCTMILSCFVSTKLQDKTSPKFVSHEILIFFPIMFYRNKQTGKYIELKKITQHFIFSKPVNFATAFSVSGILEDFFFWENWKCHHALFRIFQAMDKQ